MASDPVNYIDPNGLEAKDLGGGTKIRIDKPRHGAPGQQTHAHVTTPKGDVVVNKDGTQSHKGKGSMDNLTKKAKKYLQKHGFKKLCVACSFIPDDVMDEALCTLNGTCNPDPPKDCDV